MYNLAVCYEDGLGVENNIGVVVEWYQKLSTKGGTHVQCTILIIVVKTVWEWRRILGCGRMVPKAEDKGSPRAMCNLGYCCENGLWFSGEGKNGKLDEGCTKSNLMEWEGT